MKKLKTMNILFAGLVVLLAAAGYGHDDEHGVVFQPGALMAKQDVKIEKLELDAAVKEIVAEDPVAADRIFQVISEIYLSKQKAGKALSVLDTYRKNGGDTPSIATLMINIYTRIGMQKEAIILSEELVKKTLGSSQHPSQVAMLLSLYRQSDDWPKAIHLLKDRIEAEPKNPDPLIQLADIYKIQKDYANAAASLNKAIALQPVPWYYQQLSQVYIEARKPDKAISILEEGAKKLPQNELDMGISIGDIYLKQGKKDKAAAVLKNLLAKTNEQWRRQTIQSRLDAMNQPVQATMPKRP